MAVTYWTTQEVAEYLGVAEATIRAYVARNQMPKPDRRYGRTNLWRPATIEKWRPEKGETK
jgi:excisionase family DNA binding protein